MKLNKGFGVLKRLKRGIRVHIYPTLDCTLKCKYCVNLFKTGERPKIDEISVSDWMQIIETFPVKIREVVLSGGEPMKYKDFHKLVNRILDSGRFVTVWTNLTLNNGLKCKSSYRLRFGASYHNCYNLDKWSIRLKKYRKKFRVDIDELETTFINGSNSKHILKTEDEQNYCLNRPKLSFAPDGKLHKCLGDVYESAK